ncbi:hypothetical protein TOPH_08366 [Tolypocladium ophioglossoides CBS 100239]|uniref:Peptidase A1 domain-containing protein n=1 Tax=Tolypocladium ophioglossoides (strain CBS 100239) TaxID=1163406 RepID=A0A0L0MZ31_TOLOC|nr:hypothetical protein TOPH_08366 [Tolypocladium ophioglossoides CBS 100239]
MVPRDSNNTFLYGPKCDALNLVKSNAACNTFRGGIYDPDKSRSKGTPASSYTPPPDRWSSTTYDMFTDSLDLGKNISIKDFPMAGPRDYRNWDLQGYDPQNIIGMGPGSTLVEASRKARRIASDAFGFYWGLDGVGDTDQMGGSFVFGGYDKAKTYGDGHTQLLSATQACATRMVVSIKDIVLNFANGTDASIFPKDNGGTLLAACIVPERPCLMDMPLTPYFQNLLDAIKNEEWSRSVGVDFWNVVLNPNNPIFTGDLTFTLDNGLQIKIPNRQLIVPERYVNDNGDLAVNSSRPVLRINSLQNTTGTSLPILGRYFFTSAYLMGNRDANQFTLWQANPTSDTNLVSVNGKNEAFAATQSCATKPTASLAPDQGDNGGTAGNATAGSSLRPGAIAGIAVGGVVIALASVGLIWWYLMRKRKARAETLAASSNTQEAQEMPPSPKAEDVLSTQGFPHFFPHEMPSEHRPAEMPA